MAESVSLLAARSLNHVNSDNTALFQLLSSKFYFFIIPIGAIDTRRSSVHVLARASKGPPRGLGRAPADVGEQATAAHSEPRAAAAAERRQAG